MFSFARLDGGGLSRDIGVLFPGWRHGAECLCVLSPHDDDAIIGAGYAIEAVLRTGAPAFVYIFCRGDAGYSSAEDKDRIVSIRQDETVRAYGKIGVPPERIVRFDYPDFSLLGSVGWQTPGGNGTFRRLITRLRADRATRLLIPNGHGEHIDHFALNLAGGYDAPQAGDPVVADWGLPTRILSVLEYSVWADFSPEDALCEGRTPSLRANRLVVAPKDVEAKLREGIGEYRSQAQIIEGIVAGREGRRCRGGYVEAYLAKDPRAALDYGPYAELIDNMEDI